MKLPKMEYSKEWIPSAQRWLSLLLMTSKLIDLPNTKLLQCDTTTLHTKLSQGNGTLYDKDIQQTGECAYEKDWIFPEGKESEARAFIERNKNVYGLRWIETSWNFGAICTVCVSNPIFMKDIK